MSHVVWNNCRERAYWVQPEFFAKSWTPKVTGGDLMFKKEARVEGDGGFCAVVEVVE